METQVSTYSEQYWLWAKEHANSDRYEGLELYQLMVKTGEWLELIAGESEADAAMTALYKAILAWHPVPATQADEQLRIEAMEEAGWREIWLDEESDYPHAFTAGELELLPIAQRFTALHAFAFGGVSPNRMDAPSEEDLEIVKSEIRDLVDWGTNFIKIIPSEWTLGEHILETVRAGSARLKLDERAKAVSVDELAAIGKTGTKNIRNILSKKDGTLVQENGEITRESALTWLAERSEYFPSVYASCDGSSGRTPSEENVLDDAVFVPVSKTSGEPFTPALRRAGVFNIGPKGAEVQVADYFEALKKLEQMSVPKWRRPNADGNWGLVSGSENWRRMSRAELMRLGRI